MELGSYLEAIACEDAQFWIPAIAEEYDSLVRNGTWTHPHRPQSDPRKMGHEIQARIQVYSTKVQSSPSSRDIQKSMALTTRKLTHL